MARARPRIGSLNRGSCSVVIFVEQRKNENRRDQGHKRIEQRPTQPLPIPTSSFPTVGPGRTTKPPAMRPGPRSSPVQRLWSRIHAAKVWLERPYLCSRKNPSYTVRGNAMTLATHDELHPVERRLQRLEASNPLRQIAHPSRPPKAQQNPHHQNDRKKIPQQQPVSAFEIGVRARPLLVQALWPDKHPPQL